MPDSYAHRRDDVVVRFSGSPTFFAKTELSVVIPFFNSRDTLSSCLDSVVSTANQWRNRIELVLVDDGSTDDSLTLALELLGDWRAEQLFTDIVICHQNNHGLGHARNSGMALSSGPWISFLDSDDSWVPEIAARFLGSLSSVESVDIVSFGYLIRSGTCSKVEPPAATANQILEGIPAVWRNLYRQAFLHRNGIRFNDYRFAEDLPFLASCAAALPQILSIDAQLYQYMSAREGSLSTSKDERWLHIPSRLSECGSILHGSEWDNSFKIFAHRHLTYGVQQVPMHLVFSFIRRSWSLGLKRLSFGNKVQVLLSTVHAAGMRFIHSKRCFVGPRPGQT